MYEDGLSSRENSTLHLIKRFDLMLEKNQFEYFESYEIEKIIDFFCENNNKSKVKDAFVLYDKIFPFSIELKLKKVQVLIYFDKIKEAYKVIQEIPPSESEYYLFTLSAVYSKLEMHQEAIDVLEKLMCYNDKNEDVISSLASEYQQIENHSKSNDMLEKLLLLNFRNELYWYTYIISTEIEGNQNRSVDFIKKYISNNPYDHEAWFYLGITYQRTEDFLNAIEAFDYALCIKDDFYKAYTNKADAYAELGYYKNAIQCCKQTFSFKKPDAYIFYDIGDFYEKLDDLEKAKVYFYKSLKKDDNFDESWYALALILDLQGYTLEASYHVKKAIDISPNNIDFLFTYAKIHEKAGFIKEAEQAYRKVIEIDEFDSESWLNYSHLISQYESNFEAIELLKKAIKLDPKNAEIVYRLSAYLFKSGSDELALQFFKEALVLNYEKHEEFFQYLPHIKTNEIILNLLAKHKK